MKNLITAGKLTSLFKKHIWNLFSGKIFINYGFLYCIECCIQKWCQINPAVIRLWRYVNQRVMLEFFLF